MRRRNLTDAQKLRVRNCDTLEELRALANVVGQ